MTSDTPDRPVSRRALLGGVAGLATGGALPSATDASARPAGSAGAAGAADAADPLPAAETAPELTVMTRNLYVGVDLSRLFAARSVADVRDIAGEMLQEIETHPYSARVGAIAGEIEATRPDVVGLQEAALVRTQRPGDFADDSSRNASDVEVDLLDLLSSALADRGLAYEVAASSVTTDVEVPADVDGGRADVRLTDRTAVLVREGVETAGGRSGVFDATLLYRMRDADVELRRGYCLVDVAVGGRDLAVATAHLESTNRNRRVQQARELLDRLPTDRPVVLAGDLNSGPGGTSDAYGLLADSFDDAHASRRSSEGATCCHAADLRNRRSGLSRRVDAVLHRGGLRATDVERVGAAPGDRTSAEVDGESVSVWPSDHAGVVATVEFEGSETDQTPSAGTRDPATIDWSSPSTSAPANASTTPPANTPVNRSTADSPGAGADGGPSSTVTAPGFGSVGAVVGLAIAALARRRSD